jgi:glycine betaine/proline transport system substrate-binding protein
VSRGRGLRAVLVGMALAALSALPAGCGFGGAEQITLVYLTWDENIAVSNLTKVLLEEELGYENVELKRASNVGPVYEMLSNARADAFQDTWMPNQKEELEKVQDEVELLDPWFKGTTRFSVATPGYMNLSSIGQLNDTGARHIIGIESESRMMQKLPQDVIPAYGLKQQLIQADTEAMLAEVEKRYRAREEFAFVAWEPHWMNETYDLDYLEDPKGALGSLTEPSDVSTLVRKGFAEDDPTAYAFMDRLELTEAQVTGLQTEIEEVGDPIEGANIWIEDNREVVEPWVEAAEKTREG